jgi:hypothetical protein
MNDDEKLEAVIEHYGGIGKAIIAYRDKFNGKDISDIKELIVLYAEPKQPIHWSNKEFIELIKTAMKEVLEEEIINNPLKMHKQFKIQICPKCGKQVKSLKMHDRMKHGIYAYNNNELLKKARAIWHNKPKLD